MKALSVGHWSRRIGCAIRGLAFVTSYKTSKKVRWIMRSLSLLLAFASALSLSPLVLSPRASAADKLSPLVRESLTLSPAAEIKVWIYFADHGEGQGDDLEVMLSRVAITDRSRERRLRRSSGPLVDDRDIPVSASYVRALGDAGCRVKRASKYLNAVSAYATAEEIRAVEKLPFVKRIDRVRTARREAPPQIDDPAAPVAPSAPGTGREPSAQALDYGASYNQLNLIDVIPLHNAGIFGEGVLVAMLDTGFNRGHESLDHLDVVAEWDFIQNDPVTENQPGDPLGQHNHGTLTLSALAGYAPGKLIGPAFAASFALGKTERYDVEIQSEEDDYVSGLEWADSLGADLVSTSLGYLNWYTYADMDGNTAVTTVAADIAVSKGMAVITAAGNEGPLPWPGIIAPADGDSVTAVGAVDATGVIAAFSSRGPTYDGRTKPDLCAPGVSVRCASPYDSLAYTSANGTSLATPLAAGAAALCLQMHPHWSPIVLRDALRASANHAATPDNDYGWGVIDAYQTALAGATGIASRPGRGRAAGVLYQNSPNPFVPSASGRTTIRFRVGEGESGPAEAVSGSQALAGGAGGAYDVTLAVYDVSGRLVRRLVVDRRGPGDGAAEWDGLDERGVAVSSSVYYYRLSVGGFSASRKIVLIRR